MKFEKNEVYSIKLTSGEELVAKVIALENDILELSEPLSIAPNPQGMGLMPSMFTADHRKNVLLNTKNITMSCLTDDQIRSKYTEATTGITTPSKKIVMG
jgi:hypothetical protein